jgi:predicted DNA-binding protein
MQKHIPAPKTRMVRKQVYITAEQDRRLKEMARTRGVATAELVRSGIDKELEQVEDGDDWRESLLELTKKPLISEETAQHMKKVVRDMRKHSLVRLDDIARRMNKSR